MSNTTTRVLTALVAIPGIVLLAFLGGYWWFAFTLAVLIGVSLEFERLARAKGAHVQKRTLILGGACLQLVFLHERLQMDLAVLVTPLPFPILWQAFLWVAMVFGMLSLGFELFRNKGSAILNTAVTFLGMFYFGLFLGSGLGIREIFTVVEFPVARYFGSVSLNMAQAAQLRDWGGYTMIVILATIWICDTFAYFGGRAMGRHPLFPRVSPKKTWEGAIWGFLGAVGSMSAAKLLVLTYLTWEHALVMGVLIGTLGQIGDLVESLLKRDADIKDSSTLIPGHGGVFDRFDSFIYVSPALFLYLDFVVFA